MSTVMVVDVGEAEVEVVIVAGIVTMIAEVIGQKVTDTEIEGQGLEADTEVEKESEEVGEKWKETEIKLGNRVMLFPCLFR